VGSVLSDLLPLAVAVAFSPLPMVLILMMLSGRAGSTSMGFLGGWMVGLVGVTLVMTWVAASIGMGTSGQPSKTASVLRLLLGLGLIVLAVKQWRSSLASHEQPYKQPHEQPYKQPRLPRWMTAVEQFTAAKAFGTGALLAAANPICIGVGVTLASADLSTGQRIGALLVFVVVATSGIAVPVVAVAVAPERTAPPLERLKAWLIYHNTAVTSAILLVIGVVLIGRGLAAM
jgi:Sap, sulfolipid-1-addressing protein